jgi:GH25 family lysozyme M1 (1,4-beta-N-acetylmuramidase)
MTTYPDGYGNPPRQVPIETVFDRLTVKMLHPEYSKRFRALMLASNGKLGIGGAGRPTSQQERVFFERHHTVSSGGCCGYQGKRYQLNSGAAHAAPPGRSFHEQLVDDAAAAVDAIGDLEWAAANCEAYGLEQATWGGEAWHFQFTEYPHSVTQWKTQGSPTPQDWLLPGAAPTTSALIGPDVSKWQQGLIPPDPHGIDFGICRASIGFQIDPSAANVIAWCKLRKVPFVAYHFVYPCSTHPADQQAATFDKAVGTDPTICGMIDWESDTDDNCHPGGGPQKPTWDDVLNVTLAIRRLGHKVALVYTAQWYWLEQGRPILSNAGVDLVNADYGAQPWPTGSPAAIYNTRGGDYGPGWHGFGGLDPVIWQYTPQAAWGNQRVDFNAYLGAPADLGRWFTTWGTTPPVTPPTTATRPRGALDMVALMKYGGTPTANWGGWYTPDGGTFRYAVRDMNHAALLVKLGAVDAVSGAKVTDTKWGGVSHTTNQTELDKRLGKPG